MDSLICSNEECTGCLACMNICNKNAISIIENDEGFLFPKIDRDKCIDCGLCKITCPSINYKIKPNESQYYFGWHKDEEVLKNSSSGGFFTALAQYVFEKNGVVIGAACDFETNLIKHKAVTNIEELKELQLSKYYQSNPATIYNDVVSYLEEHKLVLFTGTACQIAGLYAFLGRKKYDSLITMDVLCHGVASKTVVQSYLMGKEKYYGKKIKEYTFRVKEGVNGWQNGSGTRMKLTFEDDTTCVEWNGYDTFFLGFNNNFFLRESCYQCHYCGTNRISDFTVADYWKCTDSRISQKQLWYGVSAVLVNSKEAQIIFNDIKQNSFIAYECDKNDLIAHNRALTKPQDRPQIRNVFFKQMRKYGYDKTVKKQFPKRFIRYRLKKIAIKVLPNGIEKKIIKNV